MFDFEKLDKIVHEKWRLAIMALLASRRTWTFQELKAELKMSDGNLITHLRTLHKLGLVSITKEMRGRPQTSYALTAQGRTAFREHVDLLEQIVKQWKTK
ncbi:MAG TPA: transcriptional regulator [Chthoniobacterales bacterium]|nr:transcriptional regulator [Chthoniobacterales bacterium]